MNNNNKTPNTHNEIGFWRGWSIAVGCAIGSGVFMMPTLLAPYGMLGLAGWLIAGGGTLLVALSLSRLVRRIPKIGGPYAYVQAGLGSFAGFLIAWTYWIACIAAVSGIAFMEPANLPEVNPTELHPAALLATVTTLVMWSFVGIETATVPADNMAQPDKTIPRVLVAAVLTILSIYLLVSLAIALLVPADELINSSAPFALAASKVMGPAGAGLITLGALVSTLGSLNANTLTAGNVALAAAKDNLLPEQFKRLSDSGTPQFAYMVSGLFISALLILNYTKGLVAAFTFMAMLSTLSTLMAYAFCAVSEFYFLKSDQPGPERNRAIGLSIATCTYAFFAIYGAGWEIVFYSFMLILIGMPIYALVRK